MDPVALIICAAITLGVAWVIAQPILTGHGATAGDTGEDPGDDPAHLLNIEKEILYQTLHELDLDYAAGKLSEADYRALRAKQEAQAVDLLKALDAAAPPANPSSPKPKTRPR